MSIRKSTANFEENPSNAVLDANCTHHSLTSAGALLMTQHDRLCIVELFDFQQSVTARALIRTLWVLKHDAFAHILDNALHS